MERRTDTPKTAQKVFEEALYAPLFPPWKSMILERDSLLDYRQRPVSPNISVAELYHENSKLFPEMLSELTATHSPPAEIRREFLRRRAREVDSLPDEAPLPAPWRELLQGISRTISGELFYAVELRLVAGGSLAGFEPVGCRLSVIKELPPSDQETLGRALRLLEPPGVLADAGPVLFILGCFARNELLFGARGYRRTLLEAGRVAAEICRLAQGLDLPVAAIYEFADRAVDTVLESDGTEEGTLMALAMGGVSTVG